MKELISSSTTKFRPGDKNRNENIRLASEAINNTILYKNNIFSFNNIVGERTVEKGYKLAHSINNKKHVQTIGGGICQVSSTLYMSVKKLGIKVEEVHQHSLPVFYAKREDEAAVSWGELDFVFINDKCEKISIESIFDEENSTITINVYCYIIK
jgi:vancomycin resistance protein YoaR